MCAQYRILSIPLHCSRNMRGGKPVKHDNSTVPREQLQCECESDLHSKIQHKNRGGDRGKKERETDTEMQRMDIMQSPLDTYSHASLLFQFGHRHGVKKRGKYRPRV